MILGNEDGGDEASGGTKRSEGRFLATAHNPERELDARPQFLIWIRRNPLKSPDSDE